MNTDDRNTNTNACKKATNNSNMHNNAEPTTAMIVVTTQVPKVASAAATIKPNTPSSTRCPATMLASNRIDSTTCRISMPTNSRTSKGKKMTMRMDQCRSMCGT